MALTKNDDDLKTAFYLLQNRQDVADLLEVPDKTLIFYLYRNKKNYNDFIIKKKNGGERIISAPISNIKILQKKLAYILYLIYKPKVSTHGFCLNRNISTNSQEHTKKEVVINIDLENFFPSINFGRVRGLFMAGPYFIPAPAATVLAQICCHNGCLPQGAPTSPIVSNMLCARLDNELMSLANSSFCKYTRYADDITFSTEKSLLPKQLIISESIKNYRLSETLEELLTSNGFKINPSKLRIQYKNERQMVTGLVVNRKINIRKKYLKQVRAMLYAWEEHGYEKASNEHFSKFDSKHRKPGVIPNFSTLIFGKLSFIRSIRGNRDYQYAKIFNKFCELYGALTGRYIPSIPLNAYDELAEKIWVLKSIDYGTAFILKGVGLITCAHCIKDPRNIQVFRYNDIVPSTWSNATIKMIDHDKDIAILNIANIHQYPSFVQADASPSNGQQVFNAGFPGYKSGDGPRYRKGFVECEREYKGVRRIMLSQLLYSGESGSPVFDNNDQVVGVVVTGTNTIRHAYEILDYAAIPIIEIIDLYTKP